MLKLNGITKAIHGKKILDAVSLSVDHGSIALLVGPSGVGKSTLLRVLNNLESLDAGTISLDGKPLDVEQMHKDHSIGMVFQNFNLFEHLTIEENITLALEKVAKKTAHDARTITHQLLQKFGLLDKATNYVSQLSGGQKQRLAIARTLALRPKIVCLDEPTSALDPRLTNQVANNIQDLAREGFIVLVATHDIELLNKLNCTIYLMDNGTIVESALSKIYAADKNQFQKIKRFVDGIIE